MYNYTFIYVPKLNTENTISHHQCLTSVSLIYFRSTLRRLDSPNPSSLMERFSSEEGQFRPVHLPVNAIIASLNIVLCVDISSWYNICHLCVYICYPSLEKGQANILVQIGHANSTKTMIFFQT